MTEQNFDSTLNSLYRQGGQFSDAQEFAARVERRITLRRWSRSLVLAAVGLVGAGVSLRQLALLDAWSAAQSLLAFVFDVVASPQFLWLVFVVASFFFGRSLFRSVIDNE